MAAAQVFKVLTEFKFEIGAAVANTNTLKNSVNSVSQAADNALFSFQKLSFGIVSGMISGPGGGVLGVLGTAVRNAESFKQSQIALANTMGGGAGSFADRMKFAREEMERMSVLAGKIGISGKSLVGFTKALSPAVRPKVGAREGIKQSAELGRVFLKSAPTLGINQEFGTDQLRRLVLGLETAGNQIFEILVQDTDAMREFAGQAKKFKALKVEQKMKILTSAFGEFAQGDAVGAFTKSITGQFGRLKEILLGIGSILRPLGEAFNDLIVDSLMKLNDFLDKTMRPVIENVAFAIKPFVRDLKTLIVNLVAAREFTNDFSAAAGLLFKIGTLAGLSGTLTFLGINIPIISKGLALFSTTVSRLIGPIALLGKSNAVVNRFTAMQGAFKRLSFGASGVAGTFGLLLLAFTIMTRAVTIFRIHAAEKIAGMFGKLSEVFAIIARIASVFNDGINNIAEYLAVSPIFDALFGIVDAFVDAVLFISKAVALAIASFQGLVFVIGEIVAIVVGSFKLLAFKITEQLAKIPFLGVEGPQGAAPKVGSDAFGGDLGKAFTSGTDDMFARIFGGIEEKGIVANNVTNVGKQEINMDFKEKFEPDRVAFTVTEAIKKLGQNATRGRGQSLSAAGK